jgi:hypothetical protein
MSLTDTSRLELFGFQDPDQVCASEYRAIYECLSDAVASQDQDDPDESPAALMTGMLEEFIGYAQAMIETLSTDKQK